jgi:hypothetical protein
MNIKKILSDIAPFLLLFTPWTSIGWEGNNRNPSHKLSKFQHVKFNSKEVNQIYCN